MSTALQSSALPQSAALRSFAAQWRTRSVDSLSPLSEQALQRFLELGLPTTHDETCRYTPLRSPPAHSLVAGPRNVRGEIQSNALQSLLGETDHAAGVLMVNAHPTLPVADGF